MKQVAINVDDTGYAVIGSDDDLKSLSNERVTGMMLAAVIDRMIESGHSKESIMKIIDEAYKSRLQSHNSDIQRVRGQDFIADIMELSERGIGSETNDD